MRKFSCLIGGMLLILGAKAQSTTVYGVVYDNESKESMPFVNVGVKGTTLGRPTDINGKYSLKFSQKADSLLIKYVGYTSKTLPIKQGASQKIDIYLSKTNQQMKEVEVFYQGNPAHKILKRAQKNSKNNNKKKYDSYSYDAYNKIQVDLYDISDNMLKKKRYKPFKFIFDNIDSSSGKKSLPLFISETNSRIYYKKFPRTRKEVINANRMSGFENKSLIKYLAGINNDINIYDNNIVIFGKGFLSPIGIGAKLAYRMYLDDSLMIGDRYCYQISFEPKNPLAMLFKGVMFIDKETYGIKLIKGEIGVSANINFLERVTFYQEFEYLEKGWMIKEDRATVNLTVEQLKPLKINDILVHKTSIYNNVEVNKFLIDNLTNISGSVKMVDSVSIRSDDYWKKIRPKTLTQKEEQIFTMTEALKKNKTFKLYKETIKSLPTGLIDVGKVAFGSYYRVLSFNRLEGLRLRVGARTTKRLFKRDQFIGFLAYGIKDQAFKYGLTVNHTFSQTPWLSLRASGYLDVERPQPRPLGISKENLLPQDNILSVITSRKAIDRLLLVKQLSLRSEMQLSGSINLIPQVKYNITEPKEQLSLFSRLRQEQVKTITNFEVGGVIRISFNENFVYGNFRRRSLSSRRPIIELGYYSGIKGVENSQYNYHELSLMVKDKTELGALGYLRWRVDGGKIFGKLPYTLLYTPEANNALFYKSSAYNLMRPYEFIADQYVSLKFDHHFDGLFFNRVPFLNKLKLRTFIEGKILYGSLADKHQDEAVFFEGTRQFNNVPYIEVGGGVENIFQLFRIGFLYRATHFEKINKQTAVNRIGINGSIFINI